MFDFGTMMFMKIIQIRKLQNILKFKYSEKAIKSLKIDAL
jgi:hypothetical protein